MPCGITLSSVHAAELRLAKQSSGAKSPDLAIPAWAKELKKRAAQPQSEQKLRLAQFQPAGKKGGSPADSECLDCEVDFSPLDLSDVPTEKALRRAGGEDGALYPMRRGDAEELGIKLDRLLKRLGVEGGLRGDLPIKEPRYAALKRAQERYEGARDINLLFGKAVKAWKGGDRAEGTRLFGQYMDKYPKSPWSGEAALHLGYAAKEGGRLIDAVNMFQEILDKTSDQPNEKLRKQKRERKARGGGVLDSEREADIDKALAGTASFEAAVDKLDSAEESDDDDESFEIHMKAKQQLADIDIAMGHFNDASVKLSEIMEEDTDWHRRVWARNQLQRTNVLQQNGATLMSCGPQALGTMLVGLGKDGAAKKVKKAVAPNSQGFSMAQLKTLAAQNGVQTRGFRANTSQLSELALPAILHYDFGRDSKGRGKDSGHFVVLQGVDEVSKMVRLFDPLPKKSARLSYAQLERQWSGKGLEVAKENVRSVGVALGVQDLKSAVGSATTFGTEHDKGVTNNNSDVGVGNGVDGPAVQVNQASFNVYAQHTVMSYQPARGAAINITLSYNSDAGSNYGRPSPVGDKWMLNYASRATTYYIDDPYGIGGTKQAIEIQMPDGSKRYYWQHNGVPLNRFQGVAGDFNYAEPVTNDSFNLIFPDGTRWLYDTLPNENDFYLRQMTDPEGQSIYMNYTPYYVGTGTDRRRELGFIGSSAGGSFSVSYSQGKISSIADSNGRSVGLGYNGNSMLSQVTDRAGRVFNYDYDSGAMRDLISIRVPAVNAVPNQPQQTWQIKRENPDPNRPKSARVTVTNPLGDKEGFSYEDTNGLWFHVTPNRYTTPYNHFSSWQTHRSFGVNVAGESVPLRVRYDDGTSATYRYESNRGQVDQVTDRQGQTTKIFYNPKGQVSKVIDPRNFETTTEYASNGIDPVRFFQPNPNNATRVLAQSIAYNDSRFLHLPTSVTDVDGTTTFAYDNFGSLLTTEDPLHNVTRNTYDNSGRLVLVENSDRPVNGPFSWAKAASFTYDPAGRVSTVTDAANLTTTYQYNNLDKVTAIVHPDPDPDKRREEILYLNGELPVRVKDRFGRFSYTEYDALKRARRSYVQDPQNNAAVGTTQLDYDKNSNLTQLTDAKGNLTRWAYDTLDRASGKQYHNGTSESYNYEYLAANAMPTTRTGRLASTTTTRGRTISFLYDANGNQTKIDYPNMPDVTTSYNALNQAAVINDTFGNHVMGYDNYGRLISNNGPLTADTQTYSYDSLGRIQTQTVEGGANGGVQSQTYGYDALGRLTSLNSNGLAGTGITTYSYDGNTDRLRILTHPNGTKTDLRYDGMGRLQHVYNGANGNAAYTRYSSNYDARDVKINTVSHVGSAPDHTIIYTYDALDQLKQERVTGGLTGTAYTNSYTYDAMGNRLQTDRTSTSANGTSSSSTTTSTPNALNQLGNFTTTIAGGPTLNSNLSYDAGGNLTQSASTNNQNRTVYGYDDADRLARIERYNDAGQLQGLSEFGYDYASRRVHTRESSYVNGALTSVENTFRIFDGLDVVQERHENNSLKAQLVRDGNIAGILSRTTADGPAFYGYDDRGNVALLTNSAGQDVGRYRYDAFGNTLESVGARAGENPYRFSTKELHGASGLYDFGLRFYSPGMGRWLNRDPLQEEGGVNLYAMVGNNPVNYVDEYGLQGPVPGALQALSRIGPALSRIGPALSRIGPALGRASSRAGQAISRGVTQAGRLLSRTPSPAQQAAQRAAQVAARSQALKARSQQLNPVNGFLKPFNSMSKAEQGAFQHAYTRKSGQLNLPNWQQANADKLRVQFNDTVTHIRNNAQTVTVQTQPVGTKGSGVPAAPTQVRHFVYEVGGVKYYYYETFAGVFISAGRGR